ncbi:MAG: transporter [Chitinophagaceae bacterium]|nr:MAG: transporter [Chitinophagaceae bacterium]
MVTSEKVIIKRIGLSGAESEFSEDATPAKETGIWFNLRYLLFGSLLGIVFVKGEIISWYRIQEMFRFQSFHMYGVIGSAVITAMIAVFVIKKMGIKAADGTAISFPVKKFNKGQIFGGLLFGLGWAMTGACPGPLFAQIGTGALVVIVVLLSAIAGTWVYGKLKG